MSEQSSLAKLEAELQALRSQVTRQEAELARLRQETVPAPAPSARPTSRRALLAKLGVAAAGVATLGALAPVQNASAAPGSFDSNVSATPALTAKHTNGGIGVDVEAGSGVGIRVDNSNVGIDLDTMGFAIRAVSSGNAVVDVKDSGNFSPTNGIQSEVTFRDSFAILATHTTGIGTAYPLVNKGVAVFGRSQERGIGVRGVSTEGYGVTASGGLAPLQLEKSETLGAPVTSVQKQFRGGEFYVDNNYNLYYCVQPSANVGTVPAVWRQLTFATGSSAFVPLATPIRLTPNAPDVLTVSSGNLSNVVTKSALFAGFPPNATGIAGVLTVFPAARSVRLRNGFGYATVWKAGTATPPANVNTIAFSPGAIASTMFITELSTGKEFNVVSNVNTTFTVDIFGYLA
jgi:hypothetical protein